MFVHDTVITVGDLYFDYITEAKIKSDWRKLTDTAELYWPRNLYTKGGTPIDTIIEAGQAVNVGFDYLPNNAPSGFTPAQRFTGYVTAIGAATPVIRIDCEDEMWQLKQNSLSQTWTTVSVESIIKYIITETGANFDYQMLGDITISNFKLEKESAAAAFKKLKQDYGIYCFFRKGVLIVGQPYNPDAAQNPINFAYGVNVITWRDLTYKKASEMRIKVTAVNHLENGTKQQITLGDSDGEERSLDFFNLSAADLKNRANAMLALLKYDGYRGKFPAFMQPQVNHGDVINLTDWRYPERDGLYFVDSVETIRSKAEGRQIIELGPAASANYLGQIAL